MAGEGEGGREGGERGRGGGGMETQGHSLTVTSS